MTAGKKGINMKFIKNTQKDAQDVTSIVYSDKKQYYFLKYSGETLGTIIVDNVDDFVNICNNNITEVDGISLIENSVSAPYFDGYNKNSMPLIEVTNTISINDLPYGVFEAEMTDGDGLVFKPYKKSINNGILIKTKNLVEDILNFFKAPKQDRKNKKGVLLYGKPGNGKTSEILRLTTVAKENNIRVIIIDSRVRIAYLNRVRHLLEKDKTIFVIEEITERLSRFGAEELLTFLDGENSWNNSVTIATTNNPEALPSNLIDRPGRFETFIEYKDPTKLEIYELAEAFNVSKEDVECLSGSDLSFDYVSFILSESKRLNKKPIDVKKEEESKRRRLCETFKGRIGFGD